MANNREKGFLTKLAEQASYWAGNTKVFAGACLLIIIWAASGPVFGFSDTWQLIVNTSTTIITFLMVFLIQNTQNRDTKAMQIKLDELIRTNKNSHKFLMDLEELTEDQLQKIRDKYEDIAQDSRRKAKKKSKKDEITKVIIKEEE